MTLRGDLVAYQYWLANGLTVVLTPNPAAPLVSIYHWVKAGSLHETPGVTGIAHLFEHMMFRPVAPNPAAGSFSTACRVAARSSSRYRAFQDPEADGDALYRIGFSGSLDSLAYFVGYRMAQTIEKRRGRARLLQLIARDPTEFFHEYAATRTSQDPTFSAPFQQILESLTTPVTH